MMHHAADSATVASMPHGDAPQASVLRQEVKPKIARRPECWSAEPPPSSAPVLAQEQEPSPLAAGSGVWQEDARFIQRMLLVLVLFNLLLGAWIAAEPLPPQVAARVIVQSGGVPSIPVQSPPRTTMNLHPQHAAGTVSPASEMAAVSTAAAEE